MKNTGIEYLSSERTPVVSPAFSGLLPPLSDEQLSLLEADILQNGCYAPIIVNESMVVVDGHHRHGLCEKHGLPFRMAVFSFEDDLEAKQWALDTQKARRNLEKWELGKIALKLKPEIEAKAKATQGTRTDLFVNSQKGAVPIETVNTTKELAGAVGIGEQTMSRVIQIDEHAPPPVKEALDNGDLSINKGYEITKQVSDLPDDERDAAAQQAVERAKAEKEYRKGVKAVDNNTRIAKQYCSAFEAVALLESTESAVRTWIEWAGIRKDEISDMITEARESAVKFTRIAEVLGGIHEKEVAPYEPDGEYSVETEEASLETEDSEGGRS